MMHILKSIFELESKYDAFFIDVWGVIYDGVEAYPGIASCINELINFHKKILFISNAPRPAWHLIHKLKDFGINLDESMILSSADVVREQLIHYNDPVFRNLGKRFYHLGKENNDHIFAGLNIHESDSLEESDSIILTAYIDEEENLDKHQHILTEALEFNLPMICVNPDKLIQNGPKFRYCAGVIAEKYEKMGGKVHYYGKPHLNIYEAAFNRLKDFQIQEKKQILMIGDTLETDIIGANRFGIDSALVLTGNMGLLLKNYQNDQEKNHSLSKEAILQNIFKERGITPTWILEKLC